MKLTIKRQWIPKGNNPHYFPFCDPGCSLFKHSDEEAKDPAKRGGCALGLEVCTYLMPEDGVYILTKEVSDEA